ncbi:copper resistance protein CopC [Micromonospora sp. A3M-1-15]|uniref:copper resistance CopC family protein n=1 Tax=Micromonospora sp. A3M-1-15 TaxID=2962035 RepID=UPI0020B773E8|nr:copper resistance protein CopC [Micromonospora sp. A3M-1-15]MCP3785966.1 copper resistance protein CopC [Micromonospora sp. A3M-1-15]
MARGLLVLGLAAGVPVLLPAAPAAAHNSLTGSDPRNGARVATAPKRIELRFLASPAPATTKITVTGPDNVPAAGGAPTFAANRVSVPFTPGAAGLYIVAYRIGSADGHPVSGEVRFTLTTGTAAAPPSTAAAPTSAAPSTPTASPATSAASPTPAADEADDDEGTGWLWAVGAAVALVALGAGLLLRRRSARG